jgi:Domain of unknown function (DUF2019)
MMRAKLRNMSTEDLVDLFVRIALDQDKAVSRDDNATFSRLFEQMDAVKEELKKRPGDQRRALIGLYNHPNVQVRLKSAIATLAIVPDEARRLLQAIADSRDYPQAGDAGMTLYSLEQGIFKPT